MKIINVTCAIILNKEKVLVVQRGINMNLPLKWEFPGGKIEFGETEEECIHREIYEELNITINLVRRLEPSYFKYDANTIKLIPFLANLKTGEINLTEHEQYLWLTKPELKDLNWAEADKPILNEFLSL